MKKKINIFKWLAVAALAVLIVCTCRVTVIPDASSVAATDAEGNELPEKQLSVAEQYCTDNWNERMLPTVRERAVDMGVLISEVESDMAKAGESYGYRANETSAWAFCASGEAAVIGLANADSANKVQLLLDLEPCDGTADCKLHFGKVFSTNIKNSIRDAVAFLKLDDFANQVEFADLSTAFNNRVKADILSEHSAQELVGKRISFCGCLSLTGTGLDNYVIIPVEMNVMEG